GSIVTVAAFGAIAVIVLLVACINFMNLSTAKAAQRIRETGIRKAAGASQAGLIVQFVGEAVLMAALAMLVALACVELALPAFNAIVQRELSLQSLGAAVSVPLLAVLILVVGIGSGSYPAFYIASCKPALILRGQLVGGKGGAWLRSALVVVQFTVAIVLLISVATLYLQVRFARNQETGYDKEQVVVLGNLGREGVGRQWDAMKRDLLAQPGVLQVSAANSIPTHDIGTSYFITYQGGTERRSMPAMLVDVDFFETLGIGLLAGRTFSVASGMDQHRATQPGTGGSSGTYIVSEEAARQFGWTPQQAIGKWVEVTCCGMGQGLIVGVVKDVQYQSIHVPKGPVLYFIPPEPEQYVSQETRLGLHNIVIKLSAHDLPATLARIDDSWKHWRPTQPITRFFLSDEFNALYQDEDRQQRMLVSFALLAIFITCLGLYGLSCYNAERRSKEVGVRKVLGGSVWSIVLLLTNDFSKLVLIANVVAWPVAYYAMERWLQNFAYRIDLTPLIFLGSGFIALCIAWVTVGGTAAKAASQKPVLALRYE
ncbi:MAG TPA: FtsX-like permease family protein, partial [Candidatus Acidoferrum sp.]|nr:FtsX-like permease family protein [Candidatus Acidoferrum sp.]